MSTSFETFSPARHGAIELNEDLPAHQRDSEELRREIAALFVAARNLTFEDGFDTSFSFELARLVLMNGTAALEFIGQAILEERASPDVSAEALRCLGEMKNEATHDRRRGLAERCLACSSHVVRDAAVLALTDMNDPRAVPALEAAVPRETYRMLRENMGHLLQRLKG